MPVQILTVPFDPNREIFRDEDLSRFLVNKRIKKLCPEFFHLDGRIYWTVFVDYETVLNDPEDTKQNNFDAPQRLLFQRFREWRKETAEKEGIPVYIIATNNQLADIVRLAPMGLDALRQIRGFGKKKVDKYGQEIVRIIQGFYEKKPVKKPYNGKLDTGSVSKSSQTTEKE